MEQTNKTVNDLREYLKTHPGYSAKRGLPEVPERLQFNLQKAAARINAQPQMKRIVYLAAIVYENARLLEEVNLLRDMLGIDPLPVYDPGNIGR